MKEILKAPKEIAENLSAIEKFVFVLNELKNDSVVKTFSNKINERISKIKESVNAMAGECDRIASKVGPAPRRRFDIMRPDGSIEIGLFGESEKWLRDEFKITGEDDIQILREIDEYGFIVKESEPHYPASKFLGVMHPGKVVGSTNPVRSEKEDKEIEGFLQSEYEKFQENPEDYKSPSAMEQEKNDAKAEAEVVKSLKNVREKDTKPSDTVSEMEFLKRMENDAKNSGVDKKPKKTSKKSKKASKK